MKATLSFDLSDQEDKIAHLRAVKSYEMYRALDDLRERLRQIEKYGKEPITQHEFFEIIHSYGINLEDLG
jgi:hypothetical protein